MKTLAEKRRANVIAQTKYFATAKGKAARRRTQAKNGARHSKQLRTERRALLSAIKDVPCADCGCRFPPVCMDFDHRPDETKLFQIANSLSTNLDALKAEIAKCDVVCANCHRIRTHERRDHLNPSTPTSQLELPDLRSA